MSDTTNVTNETPETVETPAVPVATKTPFYRNRKVLKNVAIAATSVAATAFIITKFRKNDDSETTDTEDSTLDSFDIVVD
jgi:hypothetical protein